MKLPIAQRQEPVEDSMPLLLSCHEPPFTPTRDAGLNLRKTNNTKIARSYG
jgi:hypothetical protein